MILQCPAISLDLPLEWKADIQYLTQITSECQNILTNIFCCCRVHVQFLVFAIKHTSVLGPRRRGGGVAKKKEGGGGQEEGGMGGPQEKGGGGRRRRGGQKKGGRQKKGGGGGAAEEGKKERTNNKPNQTPSWIPQSITKVQCSMQRSDTTIDDMNEFFVALIHPVSPFISAHVICYPPLTPCPVMPLPTWHTLSSF